MDSGIVSGFCIWTKVGNLIADILDSLLLEEKERVKINNNIKQKIVELCSKYPIYQEAF